MAHHGCETDFELTTLQRLQAQGYAYVHGSEVERADESEVVVRGWLRANLARRYPDLPAAALDQAVLRIARPDGVDTLRRNLAFHELLTRGFLLRHEHGDGPKQGQVQHWHIHPVDWSEAGATANDFHVVNQLKVHGANDRRPDVLVYVNGLPLVLFELKNPWSDSPTVDEAHNQIGHYSHDIPQLFDFNALCVASDGVTTLHGMWTSDLEWYAPWKSIDGDTNEANTTGSMKTLVEGLFPKERLLAYLRHFIVFQVLNDKITKKGAKYHQFFAVRKAAARTLAAHMAGAGGDKRIGVIWHTTGSGKSLSMVYLVGLLRGQPALQNPSFVIQVDRTDLDDQLHDEFVAAQHLVGKVKHAESVDDLRGLLATEGGEVIFTTIEKFRLKDGESHHPVLSERSNIIVIADEAHRTQYGFVEGFARYLAEALPNAKRLGFTGTPVSFSSADTEDVFGPVIHTYDIRQSQDDKATVPIFYAPRQIRLHLSRTDVDAALADIVANAPEGELTDIERRKSRWAALAAAAGAKPRLEELARDLLTHFTDRTATLPGKAMVVCMSRPNCVALYDALTALPGCPEVKVVMTGNLGKDPKTWSAAGHLTTKAQRDTIKARMKKLDDPLKIVIVCDMWLTGTDIPCLHTLYIDKPMRGHSMIQAISRVNRVFGDKPHGLVVDYIGIGDELREATSKYTKGGGQGSPAPDLEGTAKPLFLECLADVRATLPAGDYAGWRKLGDIALEDLYALVYGTLADSDEQRDAFLQAELRLTHAYLLVKHFDDMRVHADEVIFCQRVRKQLGKALAKKVAKRTLDAAVRDLVDDTVSSEGVVDIFAAAGLERVDISILDDDFLQTFKDRPHENLRLKLLEQLMQDQLKLLARRNPPQAKSFRELLEKTLQRYHARLIDAAAVVKAMIEIRKQTEGDRRRAQLLGLADDELAFYDAVAENYSGVYDEKFLCNLIHEVVQTIKRNLKVDWTEPHRQQVMAEVRSAVRRVLRRKGVKETDFEPFLKRFIDQATVLFEDWPLAA